MVGGLLYPSTSTHPNLTYSVAQLAQHMGDPCQYHTRQHHRRTSRAHRTICSRPGPSQQLQLIGYTDASYASSMVERRSTSSLVLLQAGAAVAWRSKKQSLVTTSTTEAEYVALLHA
eukprot:TRINITY_DN5232_c0_g2_i2.p2 TRINITY_DN5232_c0_g2~~TRINITY_DN5232_c0_g2_i2.p2  ORF type:complete len:117 (+),score=7.96 TRINITY_DN5232_c0_g2_i2:595-945(+)